MGAHGAHFPMRSLLLGVGVRLVVRPVPLYHVTTAALRPCVRSGNRAGLMVVVGVAAPSIAVIAMVFGPVVALPLAVVVTVVVIVVAWRLDVALRRAARIVMVIPVVPIRPIVPPGSP